MFFIAYAFKGQVHVFAGRVNIVQDKYNIENFLPPVVVYILQRLNKVMLKCCRFFYPFLDSSDLCCLLITFANSLDTDQD